MNRLQTILFSMIAFSAVAEFRPPGTAEIPSRQQQRSKTTLGVLRNPQKQQAVIDFYPYLSDLALRNDSSALWRSAGLDRFFLGDPQ
jgi:hypothetical protein